MKNDWQPVACHKVLEQRADLYSHIREFMREKNVLEVDTPCLSLAGTPDPNLHSLTTIVSLPGVRKQSMYLQTSPEFAMKRLLANGSGPVYQIARVFRDEEAGKLHNPEFSMLEWYQPGMHYRQLMDEVQELLLWVGFKRAEFLSYTDLFLEATGLNPHTCDNNRLLDLAVRKGLSIGKADRSGILDFLFGIITQEEFAAAGPYFVYDFPECQAALARIRQDEFVIAERFELIINGMEIANGFQELNDSDEQRQRFMRENAVRIANNLAEIALDERLLAALDFLPDCSGVAIGLDRLLMCMTRKQLIEDVLAFPINKS